MNLLCPFGFNDLTNCKKERCALYDIDYNCCCFLSIVKILTLNRNPNKIKINGGVEHAEHLANK